jgi:hypothetical protein
MNKNISGKIKTNNKEFPVTYRAQALSYMKHMYLWDPLPYKV